MSSTISLTVGTGTQGNLVVKSDGSTGARSDIHKLQKVALAFHANADGNATIVTGKQIGRAHV